MSGQKSRLDMKYAVYQVTCAIALATLSVGSAVATEGASGRPVAGAGVNPGAGVVPPQPGWIGSFSVQHVDGTFGADRELPVVGRIAVGAENIYTVGSFTLVRVWDTKVAGWNFASAITLPTMRSDVRISAFVPAVDGASLESQVTGLFDIAVTPIIASHHFSATEHASLSLRVWMPTGRYVSGQLANLSQNVWTFVPTVAYTQLWPAAGVEFSASAGLNLSTRNNATGYRNAPLFTLDALATKRFAEGFAAGLVAGWIEQIGSDSGALADRLNGFRGSEVAVGPIATWSTKLQGIPISTSLRWAATVSNKNRFDRNMVQFSLSLPLGATPRP